ncbi:unnamed protein product [Musa hybrid cultivar]
MQDEYLTSVSGYVKHICSDLPCISQLMFGTNLGRTHGPYGGGGGTFFEANVEYDDIKGFFGYATTEHLTVFGVYCHVAEREMKVLTIVNRLVRTYIDYYYSNLELSNIQVCRKIVDVGMYHLQSQISQAWLGRLSSSYCLLVSGYKHKCIMKDCEVSCLVAWKHRGQNNLFALLWQIFVDIGSYKLVKHKNFLHVYNRTLASLFIMAHKGWLSQHHVDSKCSEILCSCLSEEALNLVIFYVDFKKGSTPTSIWAVCLSKIGGKRELRDAWKFRTVVFDIPRNGGEVLVGGRGRQKNRCMDGWRSERHAWNSSPPGPPYLGVTRVVPSMSKVILMEFTHEAAPMLMPVILSAGSMAQRDSLPHGHLGTPPRACAAVLIWLEACTTMHHPSQTT